MSPFQDVNPHSKHKLRLVTPTNYCKTPSQKLDNSSSIKNNINSFDDCFQKVGIDFDIDWHLLKAIALAESKLNANAESIDGKAIGLMQVRAGNLNGSDWKKMAKYDAINAMQYDGIATLSDRFKSAIYSQKEWWPVFKTYLLKPCVNIAGGAIIYKNALSKAKGNWSDALSIYNKGLGYYTGSEQTKIEGYQYQVRVVNYFNQLKSQSI